METNIIERARLWTLPPFDEKTRTEARQLIDKGGKELTDAFYTDLDFGTGGLRGIMGCGTNRINKYTVGQATQGLANYLLKHFDPETTSVAIAHDTRNGSRMLSELTAQVLSANGIKVFLAESFRPTPWLSFAIRALNCRAGIVITASHNPPEYNGYKVYWSDGGQLVPPYDKAVIEEVRAVSFDQISFQSKPELIQLIGAELDQHYIQTIKQLSLTNVGKENLKIVFTPLHGTSVYLLPDALKSSGFTQILTVEQQATPDGNFPTVKSPNPEEAEALSMALKIAEDEDADLVIGTDPDADRVGIGVKNLEGKWTLLNGNQTGAVLIWYVLEQFRKEGRLKKNAFIAKSIVTTDLINELAHAYDVECVEVLTGFKWIADLIRKNEGTREFIVGCEESYGYLVGDFVRDKDAISSAVMIAETAAWAKSQGSSFYKLLTDLWLKFGYYGDKLISITKKGKEGLEEIERMMENLRKNPPKELGGEKVIKILDYKSLISSDLIAGESSSIQMPASNVLQYFTESGARITARPSGTEPKIKFYFSVKIPVHSFSDIARAEHSVNTQINAYMTSLGI
ncbi:phospho-sugar mutase [Schleiferia thermophila]|uniref:Phosphoglucomutase n=1 Tax=Schleiferia thermophila TaxID=884107 RepID=A0A369A8X0_9FLAO|nr:phospho-sugar mutase [Schleiferia thermophila]RCX05571.1 phosphoglucomutase [Schleiferia thermophila]GCD78934.1 phosphoglucomutase [Schleiferia thermophila]